MERPILFNTDMVRAILDEKKTCTRRVIKNKYDNAYITFFENKYGKRLVYMQNDTPKDIIHEDGSRTCHLKAYEEIKKPYQVGDILWVRETWCDATTDLDVDSNFELGDCKYIFKADDNGRMQPIIELDVKRWRPSIHMPKEAARIFLEVTCVRAERLKDITEDGAKAEGIREYTKDGELFKYAVNEDQYRWSVMPRSPIEAFKDLWNTCYNWPKCWEYNPWVWVIEFRRRAYE